MDTDPGALASKLLAFVRSRTKKQWRRRPELSPTEETLLTEVLFAAGFVPSALVWGTWSPDPGEDATPANILCPVYVTFGTIGPSEEATRFLEELFVLCFADEAPKERPK